MKTKKSPTICNSGPDLTEGRFRCYKMSHWDILPGSVIEDIADKARYSAFKVTEVKTDEPKALVSVDSMVNWSDHAAENKTGEVEKVYGMMAGLHADNGGADVSEAAAEFAMMGISPKAYQNAVKTLESQKDWYHKTQIALEEKIRILTANLENTANTLSYTEKLHDQAQKEKKEWEVKFEATLARFEKWKESSKKCKWFVKAGEIACCSTSITGTYMPTPYKSDIEETQVMTSLQTQRPMHPVIQASRPRPKTSHLLLISRSCQADVEGPKFQLLAVPKYSLHLVAQEDMTGNKEKLLDDLVQVKGGIVQIWSGMDFQLPDEIAKASLDESTRLHRRMAHVNFKTINKLAKDGQGVAERKNRTLIEAARTMLADSKLPTMFWTEAVSTACYVLNRVSITNPHNKTPYELISGKVPQIGHLKPFGCQVTILNTSDHLGKFEGKADEGYLVGYAPNSKAYRVYNLTNKRVEETMNLRFLEDKPNVQGIGHEWYFDLDYLTDSLGYTRFKTDKPAGTQETNINAGTQDHDSDSEVDEQVIVVPSFPSNSFAGPSSSNGPSVMERNADFAEELAKLQRQEYEAKDAAARYGYLFSQATAEILSQAEAEIRNQGVSADRDPAGIDSAGGVSAGSTSAGSDPAGGNPAGHFQPAGSYEPADQGNPAVSTSVSADFIPVHADESTLPPGQSLGSSENTKRFPVPSDVCKDQLSSGIFTSSSYDDDFSATLTNLAPAVEVNPVPTKRVNTIHPQSQILGDLASPVLTRSRAQKSKFGERQWILKNQGDAEGIVVRNKDKVGSLETQTREGIDYDEAFAPMDVKSALFLYGEIEEECVISLSLMALKILTSQRYRVVKALYGLHQAPRAWYARLSAFLLQHNYRRGTIDKTLFIKKDSRDILLVQVYVDDIIFGSTNKAWCEEFEVLMQGEFEMSAMGEMNFFLGLQVKQLPDGIFISQDKYVKDMLTKFDMESVRTATTPYEAAKTKLKDETDPPVNVHLYRSMIGSLMYLTASRPDIMFAVSACSRHQVTPLTSHLNAVKKIFKYLKGQPKLGLWYPKDSPFQLEAYSDSDYAGSHGDRKSTTGGCQFLGRRLISWQCKKQTIVATSSTEAEYVAAASCCAQVLWIQNQLLDYGFNFMNTKIFIDNQSTICIVKNPVFHQRTKHIEIRHHFIRDANEKNLIQVLKIHTDDNVADLLTKAFDGPRFEYLVVHIGMLDMVVSAGSTMILLVVNLPAGCFVSAGSTMILLYYDYAAMEYADGSVYMLVGILLLVDSFPLIGCVFLLSAWFLLIGCLFLLAEYIHAAGVVYAAYTSIYAAELFLLCSV
ncbi:putative ribonuclease H-like domain-containing protein [Tanacetum coccineum]|uniref:Ribonuclease H-like domain-containing protein n=1 Tax=Tanacetum coccineum TaxID=301880 RepID=A0ABQ5ELD6_9ASTR